MFQSDTAGCVACSKARQLALQARKSHPGMPCLRGSRLLRPAEGGVLPGNPSCSVWAGTSPPAASEGIARPAAEPLGQLVEFEEKMRGIGVPEPCSHYWVVWVMLPAEQRLAALNSSRVCALVPAAPTRAQKLPLVRLYQQLAAIESDASKIFWAG